MLKNISDYLSFFVLIFASLFAAFWFIKSFSSTKHDAVEISRKDRLRNYLDNEDE